MFKAWDQSQMINNSKEFFGLGFRSKYQLKYTLEASFAFVSVPCHRKHICVQICSPREFLLARMKSEPEMGILS